MAWNCKINGMAFLRSEKLIRRIRAEDPDTISTYSTSFSAKFVSLLSVNRKEIPETTQNLVLIVRGENIEPLESCTEIKEKGDFNISGGRLCAWKKQQREFVLTLIYHDESWILQCRSIRSGIERVQNYFIEITTTIYHSQPLAELSSLM